MKWPLVQLKDVCSFMTGGTPSTKDEANYLHGNIPWIVSGDIHLGEIFDASKRITQKGMNESPAKFLPENSILIALNGQGKTRATVALLRISGATCNQSIISIIPKSPRALDYHYLFVTLRSMYQQLRDMTGHKNRAGLNMGLIGRVEIPLPPLADQKRIAGILDAADALRAKRREALAQLDTLLQATFIDMFGDPVTNPMGWELAELRNHTTKVGSGATPKGGNDSYKAEGIALIRSLNVRNGEFRWKNLARIDDTQACKLSNVIVEEHDVLLNITGASVARVCRVPEDVVPARVNQHVCIIRTTSSIEPRFLEKLLLAGSMKSKLLGIGESGATRQAITKAQVLALEVLLPPLDLQRRFAAIVESIEKQKVRQHTHLAELDTLFASLQQRAFNGEL